MREKPDIPDSRIAEHLRDTYGLEIRQVEFLPLGYDMNTASYRIDTAVGISYFLKLRKNKFEPNSVLVPRYLYDQGIRQVIPPVVTLDGGFWSMLDSAACILSPFIEGQTGFDVPLTDAQWIEFGRSLRSLHDTDLPPQLSNMVREEDYSAEWREKVRIYQREVAIRSYSDPLAAEMADFMRQHHDKILRVVDRAGALAQVLQSQPQKPVLCHSDIHGGNLLLASDGSLYMVDWDDLIIAPRERDLMFVGGWSAGSTGGDEALFYQGYGPVERNLAALAYYRYDRHVQDMAAFCEQILQALGDEEDRREGLGYFTNSFGPGGDYELATRDDRKYQEGQA